MYAGIVNRYQDYAGVVAPQDSSGAFVSLKRRELRIIGFGETDRMSTFAVMGGRGDGCAISQRPGNGGDGIRPNERHIGERDDPTVGLGARAHPARETRAHAFVRARANANFHARTLQRIRQLAILRR